MKNFFLYSTLAVILLFGLSTDLVGAAQKISPAITSAAYSKSVREGSTDGWNIKMRLDAAILQYNALKAYEAYNILAPISRSDLKSNEDQCRYFLLEVVLLGNRNYTDRIESFKKTWLDFNPIAKCKSFLAKQLIDTDLAQEAESSAESDIILVKIDGILKKDNTDTLAWFAKGVVLGRENRNQEAIEAYKKALKIDPYLPLAHNNLGYELFKIVSDGENSSKLSAYSKAITHLKRSIELDPEYPRPLNTLGAIYMNVGDEKKAVNYWIKAAKHVDRMAYSNPGYAKPYENLTLYYTEKGNPKEAQKWQAMVDKVKNAAR